jgi:hypothetical protein
MREEANPRKFLRRAVAYGASQSPITFSHSGFRRFAFAPLSAARTICSVPSSRSAPPLGCLIATQLLETSVTRSKQTTATSSNHYFFGRFAASLALPLDLANERRLEQSFSAISARAY